MKHIDAVVVGANIRGLVTTYLLDRLGYRTVLLERSPYIGGADGSFETSTGAVFDFGLHVLDYMRAPIATRLFTHILNGEVLQTTLKRAMVIRNTLMPYAPAPEQIPDKIRQTMATPPFVDEIGDALPTRQNLAQVYGQAYADLIFDEVLVSYPTEARHLKFGVDEAELLVNIYPWYFPHAKRKGRTGDISRAFHDRLRASINQDILYPKQGGFGGFARAFLQQFDAERTDVVTAIDDLHIELEPGTHTIKWIRAKGEQYQAEQYFWAASWPGLCRVLDLPCQHVATDRVMLGSFVLNQPAATDYHEILVGDPNHPLNRVYFPGAFRHTDEPLMQVEFAVPVAEDWPEDREHWQQAWWRSLQQLGVVDGCHQIEAFDYRAFPMHFNGYGVEGERLRDADPSLLSPESNIHPIVPSMANFNLNSYLPRVIDEVTSRLAVSPFVSELQT